MLNVFNWSDYIEPSLIEQFESETGIKVNYGEMDNNDILDTKLRAGRSGFDLVVPSASFLANQIKSGIYQKLDRSRITNWDKLDPQIMKALEVRGDRMH